MGMRSIVFGLALIGVTAAAPSNALAVAGGGAATGDVGTAGGEFGSPSASVGIGSDTGTATGSQGGAGVGAPGTAGAAGAPGASGAGAVGGVTGGGGSSSPSVSAPEPLVWAISAVGLGLAARLRRRRQ